MVRRGLVERTVAPRLMLATGGEGGGYLSTTEAHRELFEMAAFRLTDRQRRAMKQNLGAWGGDALSYTSTMKGDLPLDRGRRRANVVARRGISIALAPTEERLNLSFSYL